MTDLDKKLRYILLFAYYQGKDDNGYSDTQINNDMNAIKSLIKEEAERHANEVIGLDSNDRWTDNEVWLETRDLQRQEQRQRNNYQVTDKTIERIESDE